MKPQGIIDGFAYLARQAASDALTPQEQAGLHRLERTLARRRPPRSRAKVWGVLALAATLSVGVGIVFSRERALTFQVTHGRVSEGGYIVSESADAAVSFSDQSNLGMDPGTRLRVSHLEVRGATMMLEGGLLHVHIRPRPQASWAIDAGPYVVHVTGTEFDLAWKVDEQVLDLMLHKGSVTVDGPLANGEIRMLAGQHLVASARDGSLSIVDEHALKPAVDPGLGVAPPQAGPGVVSTGLMASPEPPASSLAAHTAGASSSPAHATGLSWAGRVARGDFEGVIEGAERRGIDRALAEAPLVDLAALADAARYAHRPDVARRALTVERTRFPGSVQARDAAFFLGGLAESQGEDAAALDWYETYMRESSSGAYASQALGRRIMLVQRLRGTEDARRVASEYLERFRDGPYAPYARKLLQMQ